MSEKEALLQQNAFFAINYPSKIRKSAVPPEHLRIEISSRALVTFQIIGKARKQGEAI